MRTHIHMHSCMHMLGIPKSNCLLTVAMNSALMYLSLHELADWTEASVKVAGKSTLEPDPGLDPSP